LTSIDQELAGDILAANGLTASRLGLRFDRVALAVLGELRACAETTAPAGVVVLATVTAPIRLPARTVDAVKPQIAGLLARGVAGEDLCLEAHGNAVRLRRLAVSSRHRFVGFVHNPGSPSAALLDLAEQWLLQAPQPPRSRP
jgi:hypothetical protein